MSRTRLSQLLGSLIVLTVAIVVYLAAPPAPRAQSVDDDDCNLTNTGFVCATRTICHPVWWIFQRCTTEYLRGPASRIH